MSWTPDSWRARPIAQQPVYEDDDALRAARAELAALPPLVMPLIPRSAATDLAMDLSFVKPRDCRYSLSNSLRIASEMATACSTSQPPGLRCWLLCAGTLVKLSSLAFRPS